MFRWHEERFLYREAARGARFLTFRQARWRYHRIDHSIMRHRARETGPRPAPRYFAYLLRCADGSYYAGYTNDPLVRLAAHGRGRASKYTRGRGPFVLAAVWRCPTLAAALRLERRLKSISHANKQRLASGAPLGLILPRVGRVGARRVGAYAPARL